MNLLKSPLANGKEREASKWKLAITFWETELFVK